MTSPDAPIPAGTLCHYDGVVVRVYATVWTGEIWDGRYRCVLPGGRRWVFATREQLEPIGGGS